MQLDVEVSPPVVPYTIIGIETKRLKQVSETDSNIIRAGLEAISKKRM